MITPFLNLADWLTKLGFILLCSGILLAIPGSAQQRLAHQSALRVVSIEETHGSGMCIGYCIFELRITGTSVRYRQRAFPQNRKWIPDKTVKDKITKEEWSRFLGTFDVADFVSLPDRIGCPGCVDEIVQNIEIKLSDGSKKSVFYNSGGNPPSIADLVAKIDLLESAMREKMKRKYPGNPD